MGSFTVLLSSSPALSDCVYSVKALGPARVGLRTAPSCRLSDTLIGIKSVLICQKVIDGEVSLSGLRGSDVEAIFFKRPTSPCLEESRTIILQ